eukprot:6326822-Pyramimonas_sp.AAC.1
MRHNAFLDRKEGFRKSSHTRKSREDKDMMALFDMTDSESDASGIQAQSPSIQGIPEEGENDSNIIDAAAAKSQNNGFTQSTPQQEKDQFMTTHEWNGEPNSKIDNPT